MTDGTLTPEQQVAANAAAAKAAADAAAAPGQQATPPEGYVEVARFNGIMQRNEALTSQLAEANTNLVTGTSLQEQTQKQIADLEAANKLQLEEAQKSAETFKGQVTDLETQGAVGSALQLKLDVATEMGQPELMALAKHIPNTTDKDAIKEAFTAFAGFANGAVEKREGQLLSGTSPASAAVDSAPALPTTPQGWMDRVNALPLGSPEREAALKAFGKAANEQQK